MYHGIRERLHHEEWPHRVIDNLARPEQLVRHMLKRIGTMAGPYQMFDFLMDVFLLDNDRTVVHYEDVYRPGFDAFIRRRPQFRSANATSAVFTVRFVYGDGWTEPGGNKFELDRAKPPDTVSNLGPGAEHNFLHPLIEFWDNAAALTRSHDGHWSPSKKPRAVHHMAEDVTGAYRLQARHVDPLVGFVHNALTVLPNLVLADGETQAEREIRQEREAQAAKNAEIEEVRKAVEESTKASKRQSQKALDELDAIATIKAAMAAGKDLKDLDYVESKFLKETLGPDLLRTLGMMGAEEESPLPPKPGAEGNPGKTKKKKKTKKQKKKKKKKKTQKTEL
jgi:hypothetical protein